MKKIIAATTLASLLLAEAALAATGTINFEGAIVKAPCPISTATWVSYAQKPASYRMARQATPTPYCADATATQSVQISRIVTTESRTADVRNEPVRSMVTIVYN
jgi:type 1 fimbria pilin